MGNYLEEFGDYLKADELRGKQVRAVIESVTKEPIKNESGTEAKLVLRFVGKEKGLVLNRTNADTLAEITGSQMTEDWVGAMVVLYVDPNVTFGGKKVSGIRIRRAAAPAAAPPPPPPKPEPEPDPIVADDIPF